MKRTICTAYFDDKGRRLKLPHSNMSTNANNAVMRAHWNMLANTYGAYSSQVYDVETAELYAEYVQTFKKGVRQVITTSEYEVRRFGDPIRRTSVHALFHDLEILK